MILRPFRLPSIFVAAHYASPKPPVASDRKWPNSVLGAAGQACALLRVLDRNRQLHFAEAHKIDVPLCQ
jgi:hypothetical protein